ncbi:MAG: zinc-ribbon domain-containing protein [Bernardetiaceae bacterium]|nr:zinc-ribbon domain-containing protein [Bernardetiaceae bacterium]
MIISCKNCGTKLKFDENKVKALAFNLRCPKCGFINRVNLDNNAAYDKEDDKTQVISKEDDKTQVFANDNDDKTVISSANSSTQSAASEFDKIKRKFTKYVASRNPDKIGKHPIAWLVKTEKDSTTIAYNIYQGLNLIGRTASQQIDIGIQGDNYISRRHCVIEANLRNGKINLIIMDNSKANAGRKSTNGTYIGNEEERLEELDEVYLNDREKIRIGRTYFTIQFNS